MQKKLMGILLVIEAKSGKKNDEGSYENKGDSIAKLKVDPDIEPLKQIGILTHEFFHFIFDVFDIRKNNKKVPFRSEQIICYEIQDLVIKTFQKYLKNRKLTKL